MLRVQSLNVYVSKLRKYLAKDASINFHNIHGVGYRMTIK
jgi:DNA-binding response OmpR family regulator